MYDILVVILFMIVCMVVCVNGYNEVVELVKYFFVFVINVFLDVYYFF